MGREEVFGVIVNGVMRLSAEGVGIAEGWASLPRHYAHVSLDAFVVMPNHVHGIVVLGHNAVEARERAPLSEVVRGFKTYAARRVNRIRSVRGAPVWQRNYYDRIIRDERELQNIRRYIAENPARWDDDVENPRRLR
jgi:putative transposase